MNGHTDEAIDHEDASDEQREATMFLDALLNGDEKLNRFAKLINTRFESQARRTNKLRKEQRDQIAALRHDLEPAIKVAKAFSVIFDIGDIIHDVWPYVAGIGGAFFTVGSVLVAVGVLRFP